MKRIGSPLLFFLLNILITATLCYAGTGSNSDNIIQWPGSMLDSNMVVQPKVTDDYIVLHNDEKGIGGSNKESGIVKVTIKDRYNDWPLYAKVTFKDKNTSNTIIHYSDPVSGQFTVPIPSGNYTVTSQSFLPYINGTFTPTDGNIEIALTPTYCFGNINGGLSEDFESGIPNTLPGDSWEADTGWETTSSAENNLTGGTGNAAVLDLNGLTGAYDISLTTKPIFIDIDNLYTSYLFFRVYYLTFFEDATLDVEIQIDDDDKWYSVDSFNKSLGSFKKESDIIKVYNLNLNYIKSNFRIRWRCQNSNNPLNKAVMAQIDEVRLGTACVMPGGLLAGNIIDDNTSKGINGALIKSSENPVLSSFGFPGDPNIEDGLYFMYLTDGEKTLQATKDNYQSTTTTADVISGETVRVDYTLKAGMLSFSQSLIESALFTDETETTTVTIKNEGTLNVSLNIMESPGISSKAGTDIIAVQQKSTLTSAISLASIKDKSKESQVTNWQHDDGNFEKIEQIKGQYLWFNAFEYDENQLPFQINEIQTIFPDTAVLGESLRLCIWQYDRILNQNHPIVNTIVTIQYNDNLTWSSYKLISPVVINTPGEFYVGFINIEGNDDTASQVTYSDTTGAKGFSYIAGYDKYEPISNEFLYSNPPEEPNLPVIYANTDGGEYEISPKDVINITPVSGNWAIRAVSSEFNINWLASSTSEEPLQHGSNFNLEPGASIDLNVKIDPSGLQSGSYDASLQILTNTPYGNVTIPILADIMERFKIIFLAQNGRVEGLAEQFVNSGETSSTVEAIPDENYVFKEWTGDYEGVENPLTLTDVQKEMTIEANFKARNSAVDFSSGTKSCFLNAIEN